jgi:PEGA domain
VTGRQILLGVLMLVVATAGAGCATLVNGTSQQVSFSSDPPGATVIADGINVGTTPVTFSLTRRDSHAIRIKKTGYVPYETTTVSVCNPNWMAIESFFLPALLISYPIDYHYGGDCRVEPEEVSAHLLPAPAGASAAAAP